MLAAPRRAGKCMATSAARNPLPAMRIAVATSGGNDVLAGNGGRGTFPSRFQKSIFALQESYFVL